MGTHFNKSMCFFHKLKEFLTRFSSLLLYCSKRRTCHSSLIPKPSLWPRYPLQMKVSAVHKHFSELGHAACGVLHINTAGRKCAQRKEKQWTDGPCCCQQVRLRESQSMQASWKDDVSTSTCDFIRWSKAKVYLVNNKFSYTPNNNDIMVFLLSFGVHTL